MEIYLVGGAVRDQLLGLPVKDRDWVVVGATPEMLLAQGYQQVGKDFPVFLNPESHEEYALARTERKSGKGYTGFICDFSDDITLEQDLIRRDLTINAIAQDKDGKLHDPYHGVEDIHQRILRHISPAFAEDPLRVLRVARFAARFHHLGFSIAEETLKLMAELTKQGELTHRTLPNITLKLIVLFIPCSYCNKPLNSLKIAIGIKVRSVLQRFVMILEKPLPQKKCGQVIMVTKKPGLNRLVHYANVLESLIIFKN